MKKKCFFIFSVLIFFKCLESGPDETLNEQKYRKALDAARDTLSTMLQDTSEVNPILEKLVSKYDQDQEIQKFKQNAFSTTAPKPVQRANPVNRPRLVTIKTPKSEIAGLKLSGIIERGSVRKALINSNIYETGDHVNDLKITEIGKKHVVLAGKNKTYRLSLKEK